MANPNDPEPLDIFVCCDCQHVFEYCEARHVSSYVSNARCPKCDSPRIYNTEEEVALG